MDHVRGVDNDHRLFPGEQITKGLPFENILIVIVCCEVAARIVGRRELRPVDRVEEGTSDEVALNILLKELALKVLEDSVSKEPVVCRGEAPTGNTGNPVYLVQQPPLATADGDSRVPKRFKDTVRKGGGSCPPAGKSEHEQ